MKKMYIEVSAEVIEKVKSLLELADVDFTIKGEVKATTKAESPAVQPKAERVPVYSRKGNSITVGGQGYIPKKVFYGVKFSLQEAGAKWNSGSKTWDFATKKAADAWEKAQKAR